MALCEDHWSDISGEHFPEPVLRRQGVSSGVGQSGAGVCPALGCSSLALCLNSQICFLLVSKSSQWLGAGSAQCCQHPAPRARGSLCVEFAALDSESCWFGCYT